MIDEFDDAPTDVQSAAAQCLRLIQGGKRPPADLMAFVTQWVAKRGQQDRFRK